MKSDIKIQKTYTVEQQYVKDWTLRSDCMYFEKSGKPLFIKWPTVYRFLSCSIPPLNIVWIRTCNKYHNKIIEPPRDKTNKVSMRPAKTQISLGIRTIWSESLLCAQWVAKDPNFFHADSKDFGQTGRMPRLIWVDAGRRTTLLVLSWGGSIFACWFYSDYFSYCKLCSMIFSSISISVKLRFSTSETRQKAFRIIIKSDKNGW